MRGFQIFLAYYTLIVSVSIFIWSLIFVPKPEGILLALLIFPVSLYFWLTLSGTFKPNSEDQRKSAKLPIFILATLFISALGIFTYSTTTGRLASERIASLEKDLDKASQNKESYENVAKELKDTKKALALAKLEKKDLEKPAVLAESNPQVGTITIKDTAYAIVEVYEKKSFTSNVIGKAEYGKDYTFIEKDQNWYLIILPDSQESGSVKDGYINSQFVREIK